MARARKAHVKKLLAGTGVSALPGKAQHRKIAQVFFRAPANLIERVERVAKARAIPVTRQTWLLESIMEKLERETAQG